MIVAITEFGGAVRVNGDSGCDHGAASIAFLAGSAGQRRSRRLGLGRTASRQSLYENRELRPTCDLRSVLKGVLSEHLGLSAPVLANEVFPCSIGVGPMKRLVAALRTYRWSKAVGSWRLGCPMGLRGG